MNSSLFETRVLNISDAEKVLSLYRSHSHFLGVERNESFSPQDEEILVSEYLNPEVQSKILMGTFFEKQLILASGIYFWHLMPSCTFLRFASLNSVLSGKGMMHAFLSLCDQSIAEMEKRHYNRFYVMTSLKHYSTMAYLGVHLEKLKTKYMMAIEEVVPENQQPQFEYVWDMMGKKLWPTTLVVRSATLRNEYRQYNASHFLSKGIQSWEKSGLD